MPRAQFIATIPNMTLDLFTYKLERTWLHHAGLDEPTWKMELSTTIDTGTGRIEAPTAYERLYLIQYHLHPLGNGEGQVYAAQAASSVVWVRIDELTRLDRLFFSLPMVRWIAESWGVAPEINWEWTNAPELIEQRTAVLAADWVVSDAPAKGRGRMGKTTPANVAKVHVHRTNGKSWDWIRRFETCRVSHQTYQKYCKEVTGEDPR